MKKSVLIILFMLITASLISANPKLQAYLSSATFYSPSEGAYIETYLSVSSRSCRYVKSDDGKFHADVSAAFIFRKDTVIVSINKITLASPVLEDTANIQGNFLDIQRFPLPPGSYEMELRLTDNNISPLSLKSKTRITLYIPENDIFISDIQLVDSYSKTIETNILSKSGFDIIPHVLSFYPKNRNTLIFYTEIYNSSLKLGNNKKIFIKYYVQAYENKQIIEGLVRMKKETTAPVNVLLSEFDISELPTGNYNLVIEARDNENAVIASNYLLFQRTNPDVKFIPYDTSTSYADNSFVSVIKDEKILNEFINALYPIATNTEYQYSRALIDKSDLAEKQKYFYSFWLKRNKDNPEKEWLQYLEQLNKVDKLYDCRIKKGYQTDRGRVYLQYGPPNTIYTNENEPGAYPYEIWHYYSIKNQTNKRFVFYLRDLVTNCYELLHSEAEGEVHNPQWRVALYGRNVFPSDIDKETQEKHWGSQVDDYFNLPR